MGVAARQHKAQGAGHGELATVLRRAIRGEVRFDRGSRALYSTDSSNYRQVPIGVIIPKDSQDVISAVQICREHDAPVFTRGGGTSLAGQTCNTAVVIDMSKYMNGILEIDPQKRVARVQPGVVLDDLRTAAEQFGLTYGPDPATHNRCTLGGMIGNNSCGVHSVMAGMTDENVEALEILTYDGLQMRVSSTQNDELERIISGGGRRGEIYARVAALRDRYAPLIRERYPDIPRRVSGYNFPPLLPENGFHLARALVGSEGTCVTILEATVRLVESPPKRVLLVLGYPDIYTACDHVPDLMQYRPIGLEGFDDKLVRDLRRKNLEMHDVELLPKGGGWLMVEFGAGSADEACRQAHSLMDHLKQCDNPPTMHLLEDRDSQARIWNVRESALGATAVVPHEPQAWPGWEDSAVPPDKLGNYLRDLRALIDRYQYNAAFYGHFGQGCTHTRIDFDFFTAAGVRAFRSFIEEAADLVVRYGGSVSGEHGDGQARAELLPKMFGDELVHGFGEFKAIWDPDNRMNPGKVVHPYRFDHDLRLNPSYNPLPVQTHFSFTEDDGSFARATRRCVGVGKCRRHDAGTMCPSYMVTREEMHSTRGRARLLFEMLEAGPLEDGWQNESVKEALDLCLACKGCKGECPVNVDMATYKAEFLSHYFEGHRRPMSAYSMGLIYWWARLAAHLPGMVNAVTQAPLLSSLLKTGGGIAQERRVPTFAPQTFKTWFAKREPHNPGQPRVILWPDTFNNHFHPETAVAAVEVLEHAGYQVVVPRQSLCCGRPLYDFGMLNEARRLLNHILDTLETEIQEGTPLVALEPSCLSVFRDELINLIPNDTRAQQLYKQSFLLSEFLADREWTSPKLPRKAVVHGHCHHKALMGMKAEQKVLDGLGLEYEILDSGCCGMAGAFGFERDHYDISMKCGERVLLPAVREAAPETLVITNGFSCREQIAQTTDRQALHLAQVLKMALDGGETSDSYPERRYIGKPASPWNRQRIAFSVATLGLGVGLWKLTRRHT